MYYQAPKRPTSPYPIRHCPFYRHKIPPTPFSVILSGNYSSFPLLIRIPINENSLSPPPKLTIRSCGVNFVFGFFNVLGIPNYLKELLAISVLSSSNDTLFDTYHIAKWPPPVLYHHTPYTKLSCYLYIWLAPFLCP